MVTSITTEIDAKYEIIQKMGEGGMGAVYKVRHRFLDEIQVIKVMQAKFQGMEELKVRFLREAKTAKQLRHPNIAEVIDFSVSSDGTAYIVMEFIEGVNLHDMLTRSRTPLSPSLVVEIGLQALRALSFLHRKRFVHRDISPDNLMLTKDSEGNQLIKLIDLGITKSLESTQHLTMAGKFMGKVHYASPEQFGGDVDQRSDLYSFGVVLYELLTRTKPIEGQDYLSIISNHLTRPPRPFDETDPKGRIPPRLREVVFKALAKDPADRFQTAEEFSNALDAAGIQTFAGRPHDRTVEVRLPGEETEMLDDAEVSAWEAATSTDSFRAWETFLDTHPHSTRAEEARRRLEALEEQEEKDWEDASTRETAEAWRSYLAQYPDSPRVSKARRRLEKLEAVESEEHAWNEAVKSDSVTSWEVFVNGHQSSPRYNDAQSRLNAARTRAEEERAWRTAETSDSADAWDGYLEKFGSSGRATEARKRRAAAAEREEEDRAWNGALGAGTAEAWEEYLRSFPRSRRLDAARRNLSEAAERQAEKKDWEIAAAADTAGAWRSYVQKHPSSRRAADAGARAEQAAEREAAAAREAEEQRRRQQEVLRRAEEDAWTAAVASRSKAAFDTFAAAYPSSPHRREIPQRIADLEREAARAAEEAAWSAARQAGSVAALESFLSAHSRSEHAVEARDEIERIEEESDWNTAVVAASVDGWQLFISRHKRSSRVADAKRHVAEIEQRAAAEREAKRAAEKQELQRKRAEAEAQRKQEEESRRRAQAEARAAAQAAREETSAQTLAQQATVVNVPTPVPEPQPRPRTRLVIGAIAALLILAGIAFVVLRPKPAPPVIDEAKREEPVRPPVEAAVTGQLVINALPWGEVRSIKDSGGKEQLSSKPVYTPVALTLPAGSYQVLLGNPNSGQTVTLPVKVDAGRSARYEAQLDVIDVEDYLSRKARSTQ